MAQFFAGLMLVAAIALIVGLIRPSLFKQTSRKRVLVVGISAVLVFMVLMGITEPKVAPKEPSQTQVATTPQTDQQKLESSLAQLSSKGIGGTNFTYKNLEINDADSSQPKGSKTLLVGVNVKDFLDGKALGRDTGQLSASLFQAVFLSYVKPTGVYVYFYGDATDRYGNTANKPVMVYYLDATTYAKINWSNIDTSKLCDFLKTEEKIKGSEDEASPSCNTTVNVR